MYTITVSEKGGKQSAFEFNKPEVTIGRMKGNDIVLPKGNVSKRHSRIFAQEGAFKIIDLESTNGTYVNGRKITGEQPITENDKIYIGDFILQVEGEVQPGASPPVPPAGSNGSTGRPGPPPSDSRGSGVQPTGRRGMSSGPVPPVPENPKPDAGASGSPSLDFKDLGMDGGKDGPSPSPIRQSRSGQQPGPPAPAPDLNKSPGRPDAPRLSGGAAGPAGGGPGPGPGPKRQDDVTVDRERGDQALGRPEYSQVSAVLATNELESEFDQEMHAAQHDVATVLFESITPQDLPFHYPSAPEEQTRFRQAVETAVNTVKPRVDHEELIDHITEECVGLGPISRYLEDDQIRDVYVNRWDFVLIRRDGHLIRAPHAFSHPQLLRAAAYRLLGPRPDGEVLTDEIRFADGTRVHVVLPPLAPGGAAVTVRKPPAHYPTVDELVRDGALSNGMADFLVRATEAGRSVVIAGPTGSGKSTLLSALTQRMPSGVRVVGIENGSHLKLPENSVRLEPNPSTGFEPRYLIHTALAMQPQRIVLDECRGPEAYDWVTAAACGTEGSMATLHGTSAAEALGRLESLCLMGSNNLSPRGLREQIARAVNVVVIVNRTHDGSFRVQQITEVQGVDLDAFRLNDIFYFRVEGAEGGFHPTGYVPLFYEDMRHAGVDVDFGIFRE